MRKIGWIGTGKMGQRMSKRLITEENEVFVCDILPENAAPVVEAGAKFVRTPAEMALCADVIFTMIPSSKELKEIVNGENGLLKNFRPGTIVVDMSTVDPKGSLEVNELIEKNGGIFLRSPVTGSIEYAEKGELGIMTSGDKDAYEKVLPLLKKIGNRHHYLGGGEESRYIKIAVNMMVGNIAQMLAESLVIGQSVGLDWETMIDIFADSAAASPIIKFKAEALKKRDFSPMGSVEFMDKDMGFALDIADDKKLSIPMTALTKQFYSSMVRTGRGDLDYASILLLNEEINGIKHE
jgi:3-hydroxyisobutyrate dehydrogenase-like beta-hydroxyacid dehydrogenase